MRYAAQQAVLLRVHRHSRELSHHLGLKARLFLREALGAAWLLPGWAAFLEPTLQALEELRVLTCCPLGLMHFSIDCLCLTELQLETLLWEALGARLSSAAPPIPRLGRKSQPQFPHL